MDSALRGARYTPFWILRWSAETGAPEDGWTLDVFYDGALFGRWTPTWCADRARM